MATTKLALLSCGLGNINRGFEVSTARWFAALLDRPELEVRLFSGGDYPGATRVWNLSRDMLLSGILKSLPFLSDRRRWEVAYVIEQVSFTLGLLPELLKWQPDVIWTKEAPLSHLLDLYRQVTHLDYKIVFANGAPFKPRTYEQFDFIQHLQPGSYAEARLAGISERRMQIIPNCVPATSQPSTKRSLRASFGYSDQDWIVICVGAWNRYHKRIDYLINEVAEMNAPDVRLLLCGNSETETKAIRDLAQEKLGDRVKFNTLSTSAVQDALFLSDVFVLPSLYEGLSSALIEAAMAGLPIITHANDGSTFIVGDDYWMIDLTKPGNLTRRLLDFKTTSPEQVKLRQLKQRVNHLFSVSNLSTPFSRMVRRVAGVEPVEQQAPSLGYSRHIA